jgi:hypothetical protein
VKKQLGYKRKLKYKKAPQKTNEMYNAFSAVCKEEDYEESEKLPIYSK